MDRKQFLTLCKEVSLLPSGIAGTIARIPPELLVIYNSTTYYPLYYEMHFKKGEYYDVAVLHDLNCNSLFHCSLEMVEVYAN